MPAIVTHQLFGMEAYSKLSSTIGVSPNAREAFLLGNHGPDPLLFLKALPISSFYRSLGGLLHSQRPSKVLYAFHRRFVEGGQCENNGSSSGSFDGRSKPDSQDQLSVLRAYALGFLCHYLLDSAVHPLVFAQQRAYCDLAEAGLTRDRDWHSVHFLIEADLDEYVLASKLGVTVKEFVPHREALRCSNASVARVSSAYSDAIFDLCGRNVSKDTFAAGVSLYRAAQHVLDSRRSRIWKRLDYMRLTGRYYVSLDSLTHSGGFRKQTPFANEDHVPWPHHHNEGEVVRESFDDLYDCALARALEFVPRYAEPCFSLEDCRDITEGLNYSGKRVEG